MIEPSLSIYLPWGGEEKDNRLALQWSPLVRLTFGPTKIGLASVLTLKARYSLVLAYTDWGKQKLTLKPKITLICGPYKRAPLYCQNPRPHFLFILLMETIAEVEI